MAKKRHLRSSRIFIVLCSAVSVLCLVLVMLFGNTIFTPSIRTVRIFFTQKQKVRVPILVYHYVEYVKDQNDTTRKSLSIGPHVLQDQIKTLKDAGYTFIKLSSLNEFFEGKEKLPEKTVAITFDDGYEDFYTDVFPILKKNRVPATQYIISGFINMPNYMTSKEIEEIVKSGLVEIGAHTVDHRNLKYLSENDQRWEIGESKKILERTFDTRVEAFAYPYGGYNELTPQIVKEEGFKTAVTTEGGYMINFNGKYTLFRIHPGISIGKELLQKFEPIDKLSQ